MILEPNTDKGICLPKINAMSPLHQKNQMGHFLWQSHWEPLQDFQIDDHHFEIDRLLV
jgi:hypothetical protein